MQQDISPVVLALVLCGSMSSGFEKNSAYLISSQAVILVASLVSQVVLTRNLLANEYGLIVILIDIGMTLSLLIDFGMPTWLTREWDGSKETITGLISKVMKSEIKILIIMSASALIALYYVDEIASFYCIILSCLILMIVEPHRLGLRLADRTEFEAISRSMERVLMLIGYLYLEYNNALSLENIGVMLLVCSIITLLATQSLYHRFVFSRFEFINVEIGFLEIMKNSLPFSLALAIYPLIGRTDKLLLGFFSGALSVGIYNIGWIVISVGLMITSKLRQAILPELAETKTNEEKIAVIMKARPLINSLVLIGIPICLLASYFLLELVFPKEYLIYDDIAEIAGFDLILMMLPLWVWSMFSIGGLEASKFHKNKWVFLNSLLGGLLINGLACSILIPSHGVVGAVIGSILAQFSIFIIVSYVNDIHRKESITFISDLIAGLMITISCFILAYVDLSIKQMSFELIGSILSMVIALLLISKDLFPYVSKRVFNG